MVREPLEKELDQMFREDLIAACQYWGIDVSSSPSGSRLTQLLAERMRDKTARNSILASLSQSEKDLLGMLALSGGAMSYDRLKPYRKIYSYGQLNQTERDLRKKGLIVRQTMSRLTEFGREVAEFKVIDFFIPHIAQVFSEKPTPVAEKPKRVKNFVDERDTLIIDMLLLVSYLAKHETHMTNAWEFPRREMEHIMRAMSKPDESRFEIVQKMARKMGAYSIVENDRAVPSRVELLFTGSQDQVSRRLLLSALGRTRAIWATPDQPTEYTLNLVICRLRDSKEDDWVSVEELVDWIRSELFVENEPLKWIQVNAERVAVALETPILLGLVEAAYKGKTLLAVKLTRVGTTVIAGKESPAKETQETFLVQPNFEVSCYTTEMDYFKLYRLMIFTEPIKTDVVSIYRITDSSVFQAMEVGVRENDIVGFLERESSKPVPANVARSIRDWTSQTTFATTETVTLFETESEQDMNDLLLIEDFTKYLVRRVGPTAAVVQGNLENLTQDLRIHKCNVKKKGQEQTTAEVSPGTQIAEQVLMYGDSVVTDAPVDCTACPAIQSCNKVSKKRAHPKRS